MKRVTVRTPATSANLGPGFDCFGCAFDLYNTLTYEETEAGLRFSGFEPKYENADNLAVVGYRLVMEALGLPMPGLHIAIRADIPICRGLGSSSSLLAAGAIAANALHGGVLSEQEVLTLCTSFEGHPDNLAPCLLGGMTASMMAGDRPVTVRFAVSPKLRFTALIPDFEFSTSAARAALPDNVPRRDAIFNVSHGAILLKALETGDTALLALAMRDRLHEPYRKPLLPGSEAAEQAARDCGALTFTLSGAGPTFLCVAEDEAFPARIRARLAGCLPGWEVRPLTVDTRGAVSVLDVMDGFVA